MIFNGILCYRPTQSHSLMDKRESDQISRTIIRLVVRIHFCVRFSVIICTLSEYAII